jgi:carboxypeptidase Taq
MSNDTEKQRAELLARLHEVDDLEMASAVLGWDQATYMPPGGGPARGRQLATLQKLAHEKFTDPAIGRLLDGLQSYGDSLPFEHDDTALLRATRRKYERATRVSTAFTAEATEHISTTFDAWAVARPANDFASVRSMLEKTLDLSRRYADFFPGYEHPADPLIDGADFGMNVSTLRPIFAELRSRLTPLVERISAQPPIDDSCLHHLYPEAQQWAFGEDDHSPVWL